MRHAANLVTALVLALVSAFPVFGAPASSDAEFEWQAAVVLEAASAAGAEFRKAQKARSPEPARKKTPEKVSAAGVKPAASASDKRFSTSCQLDDYYARGFVTNHSRSLSLYVDGRVYFFFYDEDGDKIGDTRESAHERISRRDTEEVEKHYYPDDTKSCSFDVSEAVRWEDEEEDDDADGPRYSTSCSLRDGDAYGYVFNRGPGSLRVSGNAYWYFYDDRGREIDKERERISARISRGNNELVGDTNAPSRAVSCSLDISEAVDE